jgi:hypothetical protein
VPRRTHILVVAAAVAGLAGVAAWAVRPPPTPPAEWAPEYDTSAKPPDLLSPGTVVGSSAPAGWSHLVIKSLPRVRPDQVPVLRKQFNALTTAEGVRLSAWMFTAFAADVRPDDRGHHLRAVGLGLGTNADGRDTIITPGTAAEYGVKLVSFTTGQILAKGYEVQGQARMVVHGRTFGLMDTPVIVHRGGANRVVRYRYALLVAGPTGRLDVLLWILDPAGGEADTAVRIAPDTVDVAELVPDFTQFNALGIPNELGFGVEAMPLHTDTYAIPPALRPLAAASKFTYDDAHALETGVRSLFTP